MRKSGILLHPSSLPGPYGIGDLGDEAYRFADWLESTGQSLWQVLPLGENGVCNSPYMSYSAFAGNPLLIGAQPLIRSGWIESSAMENIATLPPQPIDFPRARTAKRKMLRAAFIGFCSRGGADSRAFHQFRERHAFWLGDHALFMALKERHGGSAWFDWPLELANRTEHALAQARIDLAAEMQFQEFLQFVFFQQWHALRSYCDSAGVELIGDLPLYVSFDSSDVWVHRDWFRIDTENRPEAVAGVPPDYFSVSGQRWGNPLYRWCAMADNGYQWWVERLRLNFELVAQLRLDHFRGYQAYWEVPATDLDTTRNGRWVTGPGAGFFHTVESALRKQEITPRFIAEDLGVITPEVDLLRDHLGYPGMRILQMAFGDDPKSSEYLPHNHIRNCVVYTATHDHNTTQGWFTATPGTQTVQTTAQVERERAHALTYLGTSGREIHWDMIRLALGSVADMAVVPLQDVLGLSSDARMNLPGTTVGNWRWRFDWNQLNHEISEKLATLDVDVRAPSVIRTGTRRFALKVWKRTDCREYKSAADALPNDRHKRRRCAGA